MAAGEPRNSDLPARAASALVMVALAGAALWQGDWLWTALVGAVALGVVWEWMRLVARFAPRAAARGAWLGFALLYVGIAGFTLIVLRSDFFGVWPVLGLVLAVIGVDVGAYFAGRTFGGPKIAPALSPSKTWAGLAGGALGAAALLGLMAWLRGRCAIDDPDFCLPAPHGEALRVLGQGAVIAVIAQSGDFFESWLKRRAGVKDSGALIPGHGGLFDRVDGLLAVGFVAGLISLRTLVGIA